MSSLISINFALVGGVQVATLLLYSQQVALHLAQTGHRGLHKVINFTVQLLADTAADFIIRQGGWVCTYSLFCSWHWGNSWNIHSWMERVALLMNGKCCTVAMCLWPSASVLSIAVFVCFVFFCLSFLTLLQTSSSGREAGCVHIHCFVHDIEVTHEISIHEWKVLHCYYVPVALCFRIEHCCCFFVLFFCLSFLSLLMTSSSGREAGCVHIQFYY